MKTWIKALACGVAGCLLLSLCGFTGECDQVRGRILRLHILANSDSEDDQALKLLVRDAVVTAANDLFGDAENEEEAEAVALAHLDELTQIAQQTVWDAGYTYPVTAVINDCWFETRTYGEVTLPAGTYRAVEFIIGEGLGHNWWCVLFPPLCVSAATDSSQLSQALGDDGEVLVTQPQRYAVRLKIVEWIEEWFASRGP